MTKTSCSFCYDGIKIGDRIYLVSGKAKADYFYQPAKFYMRNGDPGEPECEEFDIKEIVIDEAKVFDELKGFKNVELTDELKKNLEQEISDRLIDEPNDFWEVTDNNADYD